MGFDVNREILHHVGSILGMARRHFVDEIRRQPTWDRFDIVEAWERAEAHVIQFWEAHLERMDAQLAGRSIPDEAPQVAPAEEPTGPPRCPMCRREIAIKDGRFVRHIDEETYRVCKGSSRAAPPI